ncbi:MAG: hypothetical protein M1347_08300 [Chloroflexi bacterium]|nr:hypothetical protein [Chloroflexota bacterium]
MIWISAERKWKADVQCPGPRHVSLRSAPFGGIEGHAVKTIHVAWVWNLPEKHTGRTWELDFATLAWGDSLLSKIEECHLLVSDELGPLELIEKRGLTKGLELLDKRNYALACAVIRTSLLPNALERWPWASRLNTDKVQA